MPISIKCQCGKALTVKDQFAGRAVKCPSCGAAIKVPGNASSPGKSAGSAGKSPASSVAPAAQSPGMAGVGNPMNDLFDEEGFGNDIAAACPSCGAAMAAEAVLCTQCGFNKATGEKLKGHMTPGVDIGTGALALEQAANDMRKADQMQRKMETGAGMPWWMLGLILFLLGSATSLAVMAVMAANQITGESNFNAMQRFLQLAAAACGLVAFGAYVKLVVEAFREDRVKGLLALLVLYLFVFAFAKPRKRIAPLLVMIILGGAAGGLFYQSTVV